MPKIVLAHDWFNNKNGGAERVALELAKLFPEAPVYTLVYNQNKFGKILDPQRVKTSYLQKLPRSILNHPRYLLPLIPSAMKNLKIEPCDIIISSSSAFMKNLQPPAGALHICYCHSPMRFAYDYKDQYMGEQKVGRLQNLVGTKLRDWIRDWDQRHNKTVDIWLANSKTIADRIKKYYGLKAEVVYPPVDIDQPKRRVSKQSHYITLSAMSPYSKLDLVVKAAADADLPLVVLGEGSEKKYLQSIAGPKTKFPGFVTEKEKVRLLAGARAFITAAEEDFGIAPVEAMALGTPVVAYGRGGLKETVIAGKTGVFFDRQTSESLLAAIKKFEKLTIKRSDLIQQARLFNGSVFRKQMLKIVSQAGKNHV